MAIEIPETCEFEVEASKVDFATTTNGDTLEIKSAMPREMAAALTYLVNTDNHLKVEIKIAP